MRKRRIAFLIAGIMLFSATGCASNPESALVKEKDMDKMLEQAGNTEEGAVSYKDVVGEVKDSHETYKTQIKDESLKVTVNVDARVEIPEADKLSVYRVSQKKIGQDFLDKVRSALTPDDKYYDGGMLEKATKAELAKQIQETKDRRDSLEIGKDDISDEETLEQYRVECQQEIDDLEKQYETAPDSVDLSDYPSDNRIHAVQELCNSHPEEDFYKWVSDLNPNGEIYYGVNDGKDGICKSLYVQNNENYGNCLRYESTRNGYVFNESAAVENGRGTRSVLKKEGETPDFSDFVEAQVEAVDNEPVTISEEEARKKADELMGTLGLTDYKCDDSGLYAEYLDIRSNLENQKYRDIYSFIYMRNIDGVFVDNTASAKVVDEWRGDEYVKKLWGNEAVVVGVNDSGVVLFNYLTPLSVDETVVEKSSIKSFDEIKDTFEKMVVIENASGEEEGTVTIEVTDVKLVYTRISEKDSFDTGLIVPVWDFEGKVVNEYGGEVTGNILSINAIDGSVINSDLGY